MYSCSSSSISLMRNNIITINDHCREKIRRGSQTVSPCWSLKVVGPSLWKMQRKNWGTWQKGTEKSCWNWYWRLRGASFQELARIYFGIWAGFFTCSIQVVMGSLLPLRWLVLWIQSFTTPFKWLTQFTAQAWEDKKEEKILILIPGAI